MVYILVRTSTMHSSGACSLIGTYSVIEGKWLFGHSLVACFARGHLFGDRAQRTPRSQSNRGSLRRLLKVVESLPMLQVVAQVEPEMESPVAYT